jgi:hypothetical protein
MSDIHEAPTEAHRTVARRDASLIAADHSEGARALLRTVGVVLDQALIRCAHGLIAAVDVGEEATEAVLRAIDAVARLRDEAVAASLQIEHERWDHHAE